jgi:hypothetical protein
MSKKQLNPLDPELQRQLAAATEGQSIEAVFTLLAPEDHPVLDPDDVRRRVDGIVKTAQEASGQAVLDLHVMPLAQSFVVAAPAGVVRAILDSSEVASAMANAQPEDLLIEPVPRSSPRSRKGGGKPRTGES